MSESPQEAALPPEAGAIKQGVDWIAKHWPRVRLGHEAMMLEKIQRQNRIVEVDARNAMTGKVGDVADWPSSKGDEMGVYIGDTITNHYSAPDPPEPSLAQQSKPAGLSLLKKVAFAAVLLGGGGGAGAAIPWLMGTFDKGPPPVVAPVDYRDGYMEVEKWESQQGGQE